MCLGPDEGQEAHEERPFEVGKSYNSRSYLQAEQ